MEGRKPAVLDAATRLLAANPRASMQEIAAAAGISRATLHRYYSSREALIEAIGFMALEEISAAFASARLAEGAVPEALERLVRAVIPAVHQFAFLISELQLMENEALLSGDRALQEELEALMRRGQAEGAIRADLPAPWLAHALVGLLLGAEEATRLGAIAPRETARLIVETFLAGAACWPGSQPTS